MKTAILISCFDWYKSRLEPIKKYFEKRGYDVRVLTSDFDHIRKEKIIDKNPDCMYIPVIKYKKNISIARILSHYFFSRNINRYLNDTKPDLIYAVLPPNSIADVCGKYKKCNQRTVLVFDIIDMWPESMPMKRLHKTLPFEFWRKLRDSNLSIADHIFTECSLYQDRIPKEYRAKSSTLYLFKNQNNDIKFNNPSRTVSKKTLKLCYLGSINHIIDINGICRVVKTLCNNYEVEVRVIGKGESKDRFLDELSKTGSEVKYYGPVFDEEEKVSILSECDYAFNMMIESVSVGLSIKSIDYMSYGLPLINNLKGDTWNIVEKEGIGINILKDGNIDVLPVISHRHVYEVFNKLFSKNAFDRMMTNMLDKII